MIVRLKFTKENDVKYISHLDLMRTFQRVIRRAGIPVAYSQGFNPHQELSFGAPLALGVTSMAEYADVGIAENIDIKELIDAMNASMPKGIRILDGKVLGSSAKSAMSLVTHSRYTIRFLSKDAGYEELQKKLEEFLAKEIILVKRKQPKKDFKLKEIDIKPMIVSVSLIKGSDTEFFINCMLHSGSKANLKPELLMEAFIESSGLALSGIKINREEVYSESDGKLLDLLEVSS